MSIASRRKGVSGEREVARIWEEAGLTVRNLEGAGDHLVLVPGHSCYDAAGEPRMPVRHASFLHSEVKRQERVQLPIWLRQAAAEAPDGTVPVVCFRQNGGKWYAALPLEELARLLR